MRRLPFLLLVCLLAARTALPAAERISEGTVRFEFPSAEYYPAFPSFTLLHEFPGIGKPAADWSVTPDLVATNGAFIARIDIPPGTSLYGTGEIPGPLLRNGKVTECWNSDAYRYNRSYNRLYQSHPWVLAVRPDGSAFGVLADTTRRCEIDLREGIRFTVRDRPYPVIVIDRASPQEVLRGLAKLTGTMPMPPIWSLGYHQCRWSYFPEERVRDIAREFRERRIPCDVIWFDIDYMDAFKVFTFDAERFPDPAVLNADLHDKGFKTIWMIDPGVKKEPGYFVYDTGTHQDVWVRDAEGTPFVGKVWPGECVFPDFTMPRTRNWWASLYKAFMTKGIDGVWNDMNEPSVFGGPDGTMPLDNIHRGGGELPRATHADYHNVYGMLMVKASREGIRAARPDKRPFVLTRANYIGGHRYAATWTGDNTSNWEHLRDSVPMILNLGLSGQPFSGPDIGGFLEDGAPDMFARWMGVGALLPFARGHTATGTRDKEPWAYGEAVEEACRIALERRYRLLPYLYTQFRGASLTGIPLARPVFFADPADPALRQEDQAFLLGGDLLVLPQLDKRKGHAHAVPRGIWRTVGIVDGDRADPHQPELRIRGGSIIPLGPVVQSTAAYNLDPVTLLVCPDANGKAHGLLYEDAGDGFGFESGAFRLTQYEVAKTKDGFRATARVIDGEWPLPDRELDVRVITEEAILHARGKEGGATLIPFGPNWGQPSN